MSIKIELIKEFVKKKLSANVALLVFGTAIMIMAGIIIAIASRNNSIIDTVITYEIGDQIVEINNDETITIPCGTEFNVTIKDYEQYGYPATNWHCDEPGNAIVTARAGRCFFKDDYPEKIKIVLFGDRLTTKVFYVEFVEQKPELVIKNMALTAGGIDYYFKEDGSVYIIYKSEKNYISGTYNYVKMDESDLDDGVRRQFSSLIKNGLLYKVDVSVSKEYLADKVYNNDGYVFFIYGNDDQIAIYDGGWGFTKLAKKIDMEDTEVLDELLADSEKNASKKESSKNLGDVKDTAWNCAGVNYYFYNDGTFESISLVNHDFIKGRYICQEVKEDEIDEKVVERFKDLMLPKKYFNITCIVEKEIYNCENVSVTNLNIVIAQNGIKFALYDSNWDAVLDTNQIDLEAKEDFDMFFERNVVDINEIFLNKIYTCNDIKYSFGDDGEFILTDEVNDVSIRGSYIAIDVYDDLIDNSLLQIMQKDEYCYIEIKIDKIWHEKKDEIEENIPVCMYLIMSTDNEEIFIYDSYFCICDDVTKIEDKR